MKEELIKFETAKLAKEKGFDEETLYYYRGENSLGKNSITYRKNSQMNVWDDLQEKWSAPTQSLLQKWLRDEYIIDINITRVGSDFPYYLQITQYGNKCDILEFDEYFITYEEALEKGLQEGLKLIK